MKWTFTSDAEAYAKVVEPWLLRDPIRNTIPITVLRAVRDGLWGDDVLLGRLERDGEVVAAALQTAPPLLLLPGVPVETVYGLAARLIEAERVIPGVFGPLALAEAFAGAWWRPEIGRRDERLYRLAALVPPALRAEGTCRTAGVGDVELVVEWTRAFQAEVTDAAPVDPTPLVADRIGREELVLWEVDGRPVALAGASSPIAGVSRVASVYTPAEFRRKGYGTAVTHAVTARALAAGVTDVLLFTDLSNPTSNAIYQAIGYRPVADYLTVRFA